MLMKDLQAKSNADLLKLVDDLKAELFMLRFKNSTGQLDAPHKISLIKKDIARVFTVLNSNETKVEAKPAAPKKVAAKKAPAKKVETKEVKEAK